MPMRDPAPRVSTVNARPSGDTPAGPRADLVWTVPNLLSALRLLGVPLFLWLVLGPEADGWGVGLLVVSGITDWRAGSRPRRWNQRSVLGQLLDPVADRLYLL